ncbi:unnamed protein product [Durusdinium trenchii]|uniref:DDE-1 domain-containing protein n=1 Tax=Durusdinium trenchii TaxID=1381693 RepID=A0ABP0K7N3_9DINO
MKHLGPAVSIYENVKSVAEQTRSATGDIHRPVIEVVKEDVEALGYRFRAPEAATNVVTCVSPTHDVYSNLLQRFLKPEEFLWAQGIWRADAENPVAYDEMISSGLAQDLAGNSFTSTVVQAIVLSSFVSCDCWFHIELEKVKSKTTDTNKIQVELQQDDKQAATGAGGQLKDVKVKLEAIDSPGISPQKEEKLKAVRSKLMAFSEGDGAKLVERPSNLPQADEQQRGVKRKVRDVSEAKLGHRRGSPELTDQQLAECKTSDGDQLVQQPADEQKVVRRRLLQKNNGLETIKQQDEELAAMTPSRLNHFFQELADNSDELLQPINLDLNDAALLKKAQRLCHKFDIRYRSNEKPGLHLPFTHPSLERVRTYVSLAVKEKVIHPRLIANYDQVWSTNYRPAKRVLQKPGGARGLLRDPLSKSLAMRRIRHNIERCLNMDLTEEDPASTSVEEPSSNGLHQITGGSAGVAPVDEWRLPRTVTTISFVDGHVSRAYVTLRSGTMPESTRKRINQQLDKYLFIEQQQVTSHIWNEATQIKFLDFLAKEVRTRRKMLGLDATARALVLLDQAGAHMSRKYERIQEQWSRQHNIELMGGRSAVPVPGGFGASGGPNDGWHQWLHALTKSYLRLAVGWSSFPQLRTRLDELQMGLQSQPSTKQLGGVGLIAELLALSWLDCLLKSRLTIMF